jgi:hypothetical protein
MTILANRVASALPRSLLEASTNWRANELENEQRDVYTAENRMWLIHG